MAASVGNFFGAVGARTKYEEGKKFMKKAEGLMNAFEWQDLDNAFAKLQVSTLGSDLQNETIGRTSSTAMDAIKAGGARSILGGTNKVVQATNDATNRVSADLDKQRKTIDYAAATDDVRIRDMVERRQAEELAGYGQMFNVGLGMKYQGYADMMNVGQSQGQTNMAIMDRVMGSMGGGMGGGGGQTVSPSGTYGGLGGGVANSSGGWG